jgi:hypothetical protein
VIEFAEGLATSIEETEEHQGGNAWIKAPPVRFGG